MKIQRILTTLFLSILALRVNADPMQLGMPAPTLEGGKWLVGKPVESFTRGRVYIVSIWSSTFGVRPDALSTLEKIAKAHPDDVVCVCVSADGKEGDEFDDLLKRAVPSNLRVLKDDPDENAPGPVVVRWLQDTATRSYPATFIVDKQGRMIFAGDIAEAQEKLPDVLSGKFTWESRVQELEDTQNELEKSEIEVANRPEQRATEGDYAGAAAALDDIIARYPTQRARLLNRKCVYLLRGERFDDAYKVIDEIASLIWFDADQLNELSWYIVDEDWITQKDTDRAMKISQRSNELSGYRIAAFVDTLARVYFEKGDIEKALELQIKAVSVARTDAERAEVEPALERYRNALPK